MSLGEWDERHRVADLRHHKESAAGGACVSETLLRVSPFVDETCRDLAPGKALDLASGRGDNSLWLAQRGWTVTAVDGSAVAIEIVQRDARALGVKVEAHVSNLEQNEYAIPKGTFDLILICRYFQPDLYARAIEGLTPGGILIATARLATDQEHRFCIEPGRFAGYFEGLEILRCVETSGAHPIAQIVGRR
ncbi:MAG: class I SAM-dependent methyltransferase [Bryobacteraceae bacterium]